MLDEVQGREQVEGRAGGEESAWARLRVTATAAGTWLQELGRRDSAAGTRPCGQGIASDGREICPDGGTTRLLRLSGTAEVEVGGREEDMSGLGGGETGWEGEDVQGAG